MRHHSTQDKSESVQEEPGTYVSYRRRWYVLATLAILTVSSALQWLAFAPVAYITADFYQQDVTVVNMLAIVFMIIGIPCGIIATWLLDTFGLRLSIITGSWFNFVGAVIRIISALPGIDQTARVPLVFLGSVLAALAQPFIFFAPTKLSALWFPKNERAKANTVATMCSVLAIMLAGILSPILAPDKNHILFMLCIESIPALIAVVMATAGVCSSKPPTPPSASAESPSQPFLAGLKALVKNKMYWVLIWTIGGGIGLFNVMTTLLSQILCPWGYDDNFVGTAGMVSMIAAGLFGAAIASVIVDKTKKYIEVTKACYAIGVMALVGFSILHSQRCMAAPIAILLGVFGFFSLPIYPIGNELSVETTYPVGAATSSGLLFLFGQVQGIVLVVVLGAVAKELPSDFTGQVCKSGKNDVKVYDMTIPMYVLAGYAALLVIVLLFGFRTRYRRLDAEKSGEKYQPPTSRNSVPLETVHQNIANMSTV